MTTEGLVNLVSQTMPGRSRVPTTLRNELHERGLRWCYECETVLTTADFYKGKASFGLASKCRRCNGIRRRQWNEDHPGHAKAYYEANKLSVAKPALPGIWKRCPGCEKRLPVAVCFTRHGNKPEDRCRRCRSNDRYSDLHNYKLRNGYQRAKRLGLPAENFTADELEAWLNERGMDAWTCSASGIALDPDNHTFDHVIPLSDPNSPGHVLGNVVPMCWEYNVNWKRSENKVPALTKLFLEGAFRNEA